MSNSISLLAFPVCPSSTAVDESSNHVVFQDLQENQDMPGATSRSGMTSITEAHNLPTRQNTTIVNYYTLV